jgi:hypothetical protein
MMPWVQQFSARCRIFVWGIYEEPSLGFNPVIPDRPEAMSRAWLRKARGESGYKEKARR